MALTNIIDPAISPVFAAIPTRRLLSTGPNSALRIRIIVIFRELVFLEMDHDTGHFDGLALDAAHVFYITSLGKCLVRCLYTLQ